MDETLRILFEFAEESEGLHDVRDDGLVYPYVCPAGYPTQGYGIRVENLGVPPITQKDAYNRWLSFIEGSIATAIGLSPILKKHPKKLAAIADFIYNLGAKRYRLSTLREVVDKGHWDLAAKEALRWNKAGKTTLPGLTKRCKKRAQLLVED